MAGVALGDIDLFTLRGTRGTYGIGLALVTEWQKTFFCVESVAFNDPDVAVRYCM